MGRRGGTRPVRRRLSELPLAVLDPRERFERNWNRLQTATEVLVTLIVLAGLIGVLGNGPLAPLVTPFAGAPLTLGYDRVVRRTVPGQITVRTQQPLPAPRVEIELPGELTRSVDVVSTSPRPSAMRAEEKGVVYTFDLGTARLGTITFSVKPRAPGLVDAVVRSGSAQARFVELVLP